MLSNSIILWLTKISLHSQLDSSDITTIKENGQLDTKKIDSVRFSRIMRDRRN